MSNSIISIKNLGKKYNIAHQRGRYIALRDILANILRSPFKFAKHKAKQIVGLETKEEFWALRNINLEVNKGDIVGIIGANGAGKSTLLKILTGITPPTEGEIIMHGKVASLLEVGTGFHPELTGRENIFLNGAILGMSKKEISRKFDEIVAFSGIEKFLDTPVKYYSSGMYVRLAFSVAAHMEPDILLVDEVLAVGDAEFQKKCLGKMEEVTKKEGRTILFVSHNMAAIQKLCKKTLLLEKGMVRIFDTTNKVINNYLMNGTISIARFEYPRDSDKKIQITSIAILNKKNVPSSHVLVTEKFFIDVEYRVRESVKQALVSFFFYVNGELLLFSSESDRDGLLRDYSSGDYRTRIELPANLFAPGTIFFDVVIHKPMIESFDHKQNIGIEVRDTHSTRLSIFSGANKGKIFSVLPYSTKKI